MNLTLLIDYFDTVFDTHPEPERMFLSHFSPTPAQSTRLQKGEKNQFPHQVSCSQSTYIASFCEWQILCSWSSRNINKLFHSNNKANTPLSYDIPLSWPWSLLWYCIEKCFQVIPPTIQGKHSIDNYFSYSDLVFHTKKTLSLYIIQKKVKVCVVKMLQEGNTYHEVVSFCKVNGVSARTLAIVIHQHVPMLYWPWSI